MQTGADILDALANPAIPMTTSQIHRAWDLLKTRQGNNAAMVAQSFAIGETVSFEARGATQTGTVTKINQKTVSVSVPSPHGPIPVQWKVAANLLRHAAAA